MIFPIEHTFSSGEKQVRYTGEGGYDSQRERANQILEVGGTYNLLKVLVYGSNTDYILEGFGNQKFNSVMFDEA